MKPRRVLVTIEVETDAPIKMIRDRTLMESGLHEAWRLQPIIATRRIPDEPVRINVKQIQANVIRNDDR